VQFKRFFRVPSPEIAVNDGSARAHRFALDLRLRYRSPGEKQWHEGRTENISRSGVLFRTEEVLDIGTEIEMTFVLPTPAAPAAPAAPAILCRGRVVRTILPGGDERRPGLAVTISRYRFQRGRAA
jgi:hypothetical protein